MAVVLVGAVVLPAVPRWVPASGSDASAAQVLARVRGADTVAWSGDVRTRGTLQLPDTDSFVGVARLLGEETDARIWWRDASHWRVDRVRQTGETGLRRDDQTLTSWVFESATTTIAPYSTIRLPDVSDLLPHQLAGLLLDGATDAEVSRLDDRRIAGHAADGLRLVPADDRTTIRRVDLWADRSTGLPLRVEIFGASPTALLTSAVTRVSFDQPSPDALAFDPPPGTTVRQRDAIDLAAGANVFAPFLLPDEIGGLPRRGDPVEFGAVGAYGRGPTAFVAVPLRRGVAARVRDQLARATTVEEGPAGTTLSVGPLSVLLTDGGRDRGRFLLAGTVTPQTLVDAAGDLADGVVVR